MADDNSYNVLVSRILGNLESASTDPIVDDVLIGNTSRDLTSLGRLIARGGFVLRDNVARLFEIQAAANLLMARLLAQHAGRITQEFTNAASFYASSLETAGVRAPASDVSIHWQQRQAENLNIALARIPPDGSAESIKQAQVLFSLIVGVYDGIRNDALAIDALRHIYAIVHAFDVSAGPFTGGLLAIVYKLDQLVRRFYRAAYAIADPQAEQEAIQLILTINEITHRMIQNNGGSGANVLVVPTMRTQITRWFTTSTIEPVAAPSDAP